MTRNSTLGLLAVVAMIGCHRGTISREDRAPQQIQQIKKETAHAAELAEPYARGGGPRGIPAEVATDDIASARCDRETRCKNIGAGRDYLDRRDCLATLAVTIVDGIGSDHCPEGIDATELANCTLDARSELCSQPFESTGGATGCSAPTICRK